jgi:hypothetical protein
MKPWEQEILDAQNQRKNQIEKATDSDFGQSVEDIEKAERKEIAVDIVKAAVEDGSLADLVKGEGDRGGKIIGHTKSGKPIYDKHYHESHKDFSAADHREARDMNKKKKDIHYAKFDELKDSAPDKAAKHHGKHIKYGTNEYYHGIASGRLARRESMHIVSKAIESGELDLDLIKGGKRAAMGEIREFAGKKYQKGPNGWRPVKKGEQTSKPNSGDHPDSQYEREKRMNEEQDKHQPKDKKESDRKEESQKPAEKKEGSYNREKHLNQIVAELIKDKRRRGWNSSEIADVAKKLNIAQIPEAGSFEDQVIKLTAIKQATNFEIDFSQNKYWDPKVIETVFGKKK